MALVALARGEPQQAAAAGEAAIRALDDALHEDLNLDILLPAARAIDAGGRPEARAKIRDWLKSQLAGVAQRTLDEDVRVRWLRGPVGREMARLAGPLEGLRTEPRDDGDNAESASLADGDEEILRLLTTGSTNREIAEALGLSEETVVRRLGEVFARIGASSRAEATSFAFRGGFL
jgi:DNA-binding NarL/FixJ family response regulator